MQRLSRIVEDEKNQVDTRKRKFFAEILNSVRELQLQIQATLKRRKQRNDGVLVRSSLSAPNNGFISGECCVNFFENRRGTEGKGSEPREPRN